MYRSVLVVLMVLSSAHFAVAQHTVKNDVVITKQGGLWEGKVTDDVKDDHVTLLTKDSSLHNFSYKDVRSVKYGAGATIVVADTSYGKNTAHAGEIHFYERRKRVGIGLTTTGAILTLAGTVMIIANPGNVTTNSGRTSAGVQFHNVAAIGFVLDLVGVPMLIAGAVKLAKANKRLTMLGVIKPTSE